LLIVLWQRHKGQFDFFDKWTAGLEWTRAYTSYSAAIIAIIKNSLHRIFKFDGLMALFVLGEKIFHWILFSS
jgi:hypothetical protein